MTVPLLAAPAVSAMAGTASAALPGPDGEEITCAPGETRVYDAQTNTLTVARECPHGDGQAQGRQDQAQGPEGGRPLYG